MTRTTTRMGPLTVETQQLPTFPRLPQLLTVCIDIPAEPESLAYFIAAYERPITPTSDHSSPTNEPPEFVSRPRDLSDEEDDEEYAAQSRNLPRKPGGYNSRIEQILYENPDLQIVITDAGMTHEGGRNYVAYTIRTGVSRPWGKAGILTEV